MLKKVSNPRNWAGNNNKNRFFNLLNPGEAEHVQHCGSDEIALSF